jgi:hypothetical protein
MSHTRATIVVSHPPRFSTPLVPERLSLSQASWTASSASLRQPSRQGNAERSLSALRPGGLLVTAVERTNAELARKTEAAGRRFAGIAVEPDYPALERLTELVESTKIRPHVERALPLRDVAKAHELVAQRGAREGKTLELVRHAISFPDEP